MYTSSPLIRLVGLSERGFLYWSPRVLGCQLYLVVPRDDESKAAAAPGKCDAYSRACWPDDLFSFVSFHSSKPFFQKCYRVEFERRETDLSIMTPLVHISTSNFLAIIMVLFINPQLRRCHKSHRSGTRCQILTVGTLACMLEAVVATRQFLRILFGFGSEGLIPD